MFTHWAEGGVVDPDAVIAKKIEELDVLRKLMFVRYDELEAFERAELAGPMHSASGFEPSHKVFAIDNVMSFYLPPMQGAIISF